MTLDEVYEKLASALYVNSEVLESYNHLKIKPIKAKQNLNEKIPSNNFRDYKYVISFADILPCL